MRKRLVTVTVDEELLDAANTAVSEGRAESVSAWVGEAMADRQSRDQRLVKLAELISEYEVAHGVITDEEMAEQAQRDRDSAASPRARTR